MSNLIVDDRKTIEDIVYVVNKIKSEKENYLIKYRTLSQFQIYPTEYVKEIGYGTLINFCNKNSIVIGHPGSAMIECLSNDIKFFSYCDYEKYTLNSSMNKLVMKYLYIAKNKEELLDNISHKKIYRPGYSKVDLLYKDGKYLNEIVSGILNKKK